MANRRICGLSCPAFNFKVETFNYDIFCETDQLPFPFNRSINDDISSIFFAPRDKDYKIINPSNLGLFELLFGINYELWWFQKVHTCEDIKFFYFLFYPHLHFRCNSNFHPGANPERYDL